MSSPGLPPDPAVDPTPATPPEVPGREAATRTIDEFAGGSATIGAGVRALAGITDRGIVVADADVPLPRIPWASVVRAAARRAEAFSALAADLAPAPGGSSAPPHVGLLLDNSPEYVAWLCAAATTELVAVGLNDTRAPASLARDVATADVRLVVHDDGHADLARELARRTATPVLSVDAIGVPPVGAEGAVIPRADRPTPGGHPLRPYPRDGDAPTPGALDPDPLDPDALVALVFTSGSTGDPKAVRVTQRKIAAPARMLAERFDLGGPEDCLYNAMPLFHSNAMLVAWPIAVLTGCDLALRRRFSASRWLRDVRCTGATFANYVGTPLSYVLATPERTDDADNPVRIVYGNEAGAAVRERFAARFGVRVVDGFGSTEGGVAVSRTPDTPAAALGPLPDGALVVDPDTDRPCPTAVLRDDGGLANPSEAIGELVGSGPGLFAGYYRNAAADAERMRGGLFRTGDLAYVDAAGYVYFAGRTSTWMRVGGENLAAAPIERVLAEHPAVREVAVYGIPAEGRPGDEVAAAVVLREGGADTADTADTAVAPEAARFAAGLGAFLTARADLSARQWPSLVRISAGLPRTPSFKVRTADLASRGRAHAREGSSEAADTLLVLERDGYRLTVDD